MFVALRYRALHVIPGLHRLLASCLLSRRFPMHWAGCVMATPPHRDLTSAATMTAMIASSCPRLQRLRTISFELNHAIVQHRSSIACNCCEEIEHSRSGAPSLAWAHYSVRFEQLCCIKLTHSILLNGCCRFTGRPHLSWS